ncbi:MAG: histidine phosphatase family protein [Oleiphilus sp.]|nr:MAG: histidine phosphatase family protein [Oleiphilus sp.]
MQETVIDLIRHGEPVGGPKLRGAQDDPLSDLGWQQMRTSVGDLDAWNHLVTSPLSRCRAFAEELGGRLALPPEVNAEFREIHFGAWEGLTTKELMQRDSEALRRYWQDPDNNTPEGGERMVDFVTRVHGAWDQLVDQHESKHALLVCHGGVIRAILVRVLGMPVENLWNFDVPYANVSRIVYHRFPDGHRTAQLRFHQAGF